jgi:hypothetical protein
LVKPVSYEETLASLPPRRSPYEAFSYLLQPPSVRDRAPAQPAPSPPIEIAPMPMPTDPIAGQPPPARPPVQTDPMPRPDPTPVTPEAFDPTVPVSDPMQPERPDPIIDTKKTPTTLAELEAMLGIKFVRRTSTSPIGLTDARTSDQRYLRKMAKQYGIALPPDAPIDMTGFEDPPLGSTPPANMPAPGTVINLPFGGSFTIPDDIQERIDAAKAEQAGTTLPPVTTPTTPAMPQINLPFGGGFNLPQDIQDRINAARAQANANQAVSDTITMPDMDEEDRQRVEAKRQFPMVGGRRGLMSREGIENLRKRVDEMRTPPPTPVVEEVNALIPNVSPDSPLGRMIAARKNYQDPSAPRLPQGIVAGGPRPDGRGGLLSRLVDDSVPVVSPPSNDALQRSIDNLRDIFGRASEGEDRSSGSEDMFSKLRDRLRPTDTRDPRRLPPTLPINVGQQRAPQLPMPRRVPTVPPLKPARRQIPVNTDKQEMVRRALAERMQNVGRLLGRGRGR